jgi:hypothetical protein
LFTGGEWLTVSTQLRPPWQSIWRVQRVTRAGTWVARPLIDDGADRAYRGLRHMHDVPFKGKAHAGPTPGGPPWPE